MIDEITFMDMDILLSNSIIALKPEPDFEEWIQLEVGEIKVVANYYQTNGFVVSGDKDLRVWVNQYAVDLSKTTLNNITKTSSKPISLPFDIHLTYETLMNSYEYEKLYPEVKFALESFLGVQISPFTLLMEKLDFLSLLTMVFHNITRGDDRDDLFPSTWVPPPMPEGQIYESASMMIDLSIEQLQIFFLNAKSKLPRVEISLQKVDIDIENGKIMTIDLKSQCFDINYYDHDNKTLIKKGFIGELLPYQEFQIQNDLIIPESFFNKQEPRITDCPNLILSIHMTEAQAIKLQLS